jgi:hypothetical protein
MSVMYAGYVWNMVYFVGDFDGLRAGNLVLVNRVGDEWFKYMPYL